jgi:hypothetical protein
MSTQADAPRSRPAGLTFAAVVLLAIGCARVISAIYYFADSDRLSEAADGPFAHHLVYWGVWDLIIAALALGGGYALWKGNELGFVLGYAFGAFLIVQSLLLIAASPWYGFSALLLASAIIYVLASNDRRPGPDYGPGYVDPRLNRAG